MKETYCLEDTLYNTKRYFTIENGVVSGTELAQEDSAEELDEFRAALYNVNTSFHCCNAAPVDWAAGWQRNDIRKTR